MTKLDIAFKEWSAICHALATGRQSLILRKGGIAETAGRFVPEHFSFWLYPTHFHEQQQRGLKTDAAIPPAGTPGSVTLSHWAEVQAVHHITDLATALSFDAFHIWTPETITQRFHYRTPGLYLLAVTIHEAKTVHEIVEAPEYAGCKSWVPLKEPFDQTPRGTVIDPQRELLMSRLATILSRSI
ncbi:DUF1802 family protein [soil metagenome]